MSRVKLSSILQPVTDTAGNAVSGAQVDVPATIYADELGSAPLTNPQITVRGRAEGWIEPDDLDITITWRGQTSVEKIRALTFTESAPVDAPAVTDDEGKVLSAHEGGLLWFATPDLNPKHARFGAVGDGIVDDTDALEAWIAAITGASAAASTTRTPQVSAHLPAGTYRITRQLRFSSIQGLRLTSDSGVIKADAAMESPICFDGLARSTIGGFKIQGTSNAVCDYGLLICWTTAAARSTTKVSINDVYVENLKAKHLFAVEPFASRQADAINFRNCVATGLISGQAGYDAAYYLTGFKNGNTPNGNVYNIFYDGCSAVRVAVGAEWGGTGGEWNGGEMVDVPVMFGTSVPYKALKVGGAFRAEGCGRLWDAPGSSNATATIDIGNVYFGMNGLAADGEAVRHGGAGTFNLHDVIFHGTPPGAGPTVRVSDNALSTVERITAPTAKDSFIIRSSSALVQFGDYARTDAAGVVIERYHGRIHLSTLKTAVQDGQEYIDSVTGERVRKQGTGARLLSGPRRNEGQTGFIVPASKATYAADSLALTQGKLIAVRAQFDEDFTIGNLGFSVLVAAGSADQVDLVVFEKGVGSGSVRARSGVVTPSAGALDSTGAKSVAMLAPFTCLAGRVYYFGLLCPVVGTTAAEVQAVDALGTAAPGMFGTASPQAEIIQKSGLTDTATLSSSGWSVGSGAAVIWALP